MGQETNRAAGTFEAEARMEWLEEELAKERNQHQQAVRDVSRLQQECMHLKARLYEYIAELGYVLSGEED